MLMRCSESNSWGEVETKSWTEGGPWAHDEKIINSFCKYFVGRERQHLL